MLETNYYTVPLQTLLTVRRHSSTKHNVVRRASRDAICSAFPIVRYISCRRFNDYAKTRSSFAIRRSFVSIYFDVDGACLQRKDPYVPAIHVQI